MDVLQTVDACVGITTALVKACQFVVRFHDARAIAEDVALTTSDVDKVLCQLRSVLDSRKRLQCGHPLRSKEASTLDCIYNAAENCHRTLQKGFKAVFDGEVASLQKEIREKERRHSQDQILQTIMLQHTSLRSVHEKLKQLQYKRSFTASHQSSRAEPEDASHKPPTFSSVSNATIGNVDEVLRGLALPLDLDHESSHATIESIDIDGSPITQQDSAIDIPASSPESETPGLPSSMLEKETKRLQLKAKIAEDHSDWRTARTLLVKLIRACRARASRFPEAVSEEQDLTERLVLVLLSLNQWADASGVVDATERRLNQRQPMSRLGDARMKQLRALVHLMKHQKSEPFRIGVATQDLKKARELAGEAYTLRDDAVRSLPSDETNRQLRSASRLYATILALCDDEDRLQAVLEDTAEVCGSPQDVLLEEQPLRTTGEELGFVRDEQQSVSPPDLRLSTPRRLITAVDWGLSDEDIDAHLALHSDDINETDDSGSSALHLAVQKGRLHLVRLFLEHKDVDVSMMNNAKETPLLIAINHKNPSRAIVEELAKHRASIDSEFCDQWSCLHFAVSTGCTDITAALLASEGGATLAGRQDDSGMTALHRCAEEVWPAHAVIIVQHSTDGQIDLREQSGKTALDICLREWSSRGKSRIGTRKIIDAILKSHSRQPRVLKELQKTLKEYRRQRARLEQD